MNAILMLVALAAPTIAVGILEILVRRRLRTTRREREVDGG